MGRGRKTRRRAGAEGKTWGKFGRHHFFWGVESFCIPLILSSSSEMKSCRTTRTGLTRRELKQEMERKHRRDSNCFTSVGLKQSTSKSCNTEKCHTSGKFVLFVFGRVNLQVFLTLTLAARSTSLGMSSSSSTSISSSGMASSCSNQNNMEIRAIRATNWPSSVRAEWCPLLNTRGQRTSTEEGKRRQRDLFCHHASWMFKKGKTSLT